MQEIDYEKPRTKGGEVRKASKKTLTKKLDKAWSEAVKRRAGYKCEYCLREDLTLNSAHIIGRRYRGTRWLLKNGLSLCVHHHFQYDQHGPEARNIFNNLIGESLYDELRIRAMEVTKLTIEEMLQLHNNLTNQREG